MANTYELTDFEQKLRIVSQDIQTQAEAVEFWPSANGYTVSHQMKNNTPYTISVTYIFDVYNADGSMYEGQDVFHIENVLPGADYRIVLTDLEIQNFVKFYVDWEITDIK